MAKAGDVELLVKANAASLPAWRKPEMSNCW
jgi:hypothetical protein